MAESGGDTLAGDVVSIQVPPDGPYGLNLKPDEFGNAAVVHSFDRLPNGKFGPIQKHGGVHYGDVLFEINDTPLCNVSHEDAIKMLTNNNTLKKILKFQNPKIYYRKKNTLSFKTTPQDTRNSFLSTVKRSRISEERSKKYVEYEIACQYRLVGFKVQTEVVYQWSVWKRYSEFEQLHAAITKSLGWQMNGIELPSAHTFVLNKLAPEFIDQRREDLKDYWHKVTSIDKVTDFAKHHCSAEIKAFLEVDENTRNKEIAATSDLIAESVDEVANLKVDDSQGRQAQASAAPSRRGSVRVNSRRISARVVNSNIGSNGLITNGTATEEGERTMSPSREPNGSTSVASVPPPPPPARPSNGMNSSTTTTATTTTSQPSTTSAHTPPPPPPPARPTTSTAPTAELPPKPTGARANLLSSINSLRKD